MLSEWAEEGPKEVRVHGDKQPRFRRGTSLGSHPLCTAHCCVALSWWPGRSEPILSHGAMMDNEGRLKSELLVSNARPPAHGTHPVWWQGL